MELNEALGRIREIREKLTGDDRLRRFRCATASVTAATAFLGGLYQVQARSYFESSPTQFVYFWLTVAIICAAITASELWWGHRHESPRERRLAGKMTGEFCIYLTTGFLLTLAIQWKAPGFINLLPVVWATIFGLGLFAVRRYFSPHMIWAGAYYLFSAIFLLVMYGETGSALAMPITFGVGQMLVTAILFTENGDDFEE